MNFCGLDVGTSGVKAVIFNESGARIAEAFRAYNIGFDKSGERGIPARVMWMKAKEVLGDAGAQVGGSIDALAAASFGESFVMLDEQDNMLSDIMIYTDRRGESEFLREAKKTSAEEIARICGLPFSPTYSISKLLYLKEHKTEVYNKAKRVLFVEDFVSYMLCGTAAVDYSVASRSMLFDVDKCEWSSVMTEKFGVDAALFSRPVAAGTVIGTVKADIASELGISTDMKVVAGLHDQPASAIGTGLRKGGIGCSMGTTECMTAVFEGMFSAEVTMQNGLSSEPVWRKGTYCTIAYNPSSGLLVEWFFKMFAAEETKNGGAPYALFEKNFPPEPTRLMVQPYLAGGGTPYLDYLSRFAITGAGLETTRYDIYRAILEGLALDQCLNLKTLTAQGMEANSITCVGGGSNSKPWLQIKADVMQIPIMTLDCKEAGALGCAGLCAYAMGIYGSVEEAAEKMSHIKDTFEPNIKNRAFYEEKFEHYRELNAHIKAESEYATKG
ncbi:MAG: FGGY-family carbohydrate kinase [Christensenella sp.]